MLFDERIVYVSQIAALAVIRGLDLLLTAVTKI